jgi:hypothetical protein
MPSSIEKIHTPRIINKEKAAELLVLKKTFMALFSGREFHLIGS